MTVAIVGYHVENVVSAFEARGCAVEAISPALCVPFRIRADLLIAFPPCQYLCSSGLHWNTRRPGREALTTRSLQFVIALLNAPVPRIALENPVGCISTRVRPPDQFIQPYQFGHDASKKTCLWLKNLPPLTPTRIVPSRIVNGLPRWGNQFDSGQNNLVSATDRAIKRAERYQGIADAMAAQWA